MAEAKIDTLIVDVDYSAASASTGLESLKSILTELQGVVMPNVSNLRSLNSALNKFSNTASTLSGINMAGFSDSMVKMTSALGLLSGLGKTNLGSFITQLKKIPDLNKSLDSKTITEFISKVKELSTALSPLATNLDKVSRSLSNMPSKLNKVSNYASQAKNSFSGLSSVSKILNFSAATGIFAKLGNMLGNFITESNAYVEDLNLFNVAMGENTETAKEWIDTVSGKLGLDSGPMMRYMGVFQMIANGFGLSADNAYKMSKNLTQLTYDMSSLYNLDIDEAAQKVQSAISGELEPVRRLRLCTRPSNIKTNSI